MKIVNAEIQIGIRPLKIILTHCWPLYIRKLISAQSCASVLCLSQSTTFKEAEKSKEITNKSGMIHVEIHVFKKINEI
jgi:hypothetical protein